MKLDYDFIKKILLEMEDNEDFQISSHKLMKKLEISHDLERKFMGHIKLLGDRNFIESDSKNHSFGFKIKMSQYLINNVNYRITAQGHEFLDMLKNDTVFNKIKNFALPNAFDIGKQILISLVTGGLNG